ncbi:MAG: protein phosphatase 2C domain-containing protein [Chroococcidiopsidaceae cyanobacterium CP_BM_ER_R8_30]|nr:protein phosphatase 2C domain-containing protein [Chroococcidiopsidaceae cyanobacterium CP_BM_ER_R8_30]
MQNDQAKLYCPNDLCRAPNSQANNFCQQCATPLVKRYLWAVGEETFFKLGDLWHERYLLKSPRVFLDTKPAWPPETPVSELSDQVKHYLRLVFYRIHIPQVYAVIPAAEGLHGTELLLLEQAPIYPDGLPQAGQLMPQITDVWAGASAMRQLNWLWQIAQLWQPLEIEGVAASLLNPELLRVEGTLVRLLELLPVSSSPPTLAALGQLWLPWVSGAKSAITLFLEQLCQALIQGKVRSSEQLVAALDRGLALVGQAQTRNITITTYTDAGPSRQRNEDACYPPSGSTSQSHAGEALVIVCDGIGGHEGGNIASNLAIETIQRQVQQVVPAKTYIEPTNLIGHLEHAACAANDSISQRNDSEHRHGRQRMGTTLVMGLAQAHEIYITHVGDSRAYWITRKGCHQVTLDDDVASREVRLGYSLYQEALQQASSGSLVQALGMSSSASLYPTVQRFVLDEDSVFLLCSDGLSDYDRVEQFWEAEILPVLDGKDLATVGTRLVEIANAENGHDNVTVGLLYFQVNSSEPAEVPASIVQEVAALPSIYSTTKQIETEKSEHLPDSVLLSTSSTQPMQLLSSRPAARRSWLPIFVGIILFLGLSGALLAYLFLQGIIPFSSQPSPPPVIQSNTPSPTTSSNLVK